MQRKRAELQKICHRDVMSLVRVIGPFIKACDDAAEDPSERDKRRFERARARLLNAIKQWQADRAMIERPLREGV